MATALAPTPIGELTDLVDQFSTPQELPPPEWLRCLQLERPRRNLQCLCLASRACKRATDLVVAASLLVLLAPVLLLVAALVRLTSPGPIIFKQFLPGRTRRGSG